MTLLIFVGSFWLIIYHHIVYPVVLRLFRGMSSSSRDPLPAPLGSWPTMTLIVPSHNEERLIARKIANIASLDCPSDRLRVVLACDGCTDATEAVARQTLSGLATPFDIRVVSYPNNIGKVAVLNDQIARATSEIVVLSDASARVAEDALARVAAGFQASSVGVVCGSYAACPSDGPGETTYWRYQTNLKAAEAAVACPMGAHGAFYAFRRSLWSALPPDTVNDDFVLPMTIVLGGSRAIYDTSIAVHELDWSTNRQGFWRRVRIGAGNIQQFVRLIRLADPRRPRLAFLFLSGKALRALMPFLLMSMMIAAVVLTAGNWATLGVLTIGLVAIGVLALAEGGYLSFGLHRNLRPAAYVAQGHAALALGTLLWLVGSSDKAWNVSRSAKKRVADPKNRVWISGES